MFDDKCTLEERASQLKVSYQLRAIKNVKLSLNLSSRTVTCVTDVVFETGAVKAQPAIGVGNEQ